MKDLTDVRNWKNGYMVVRTEGEHGDMKIGDRDLITKVSTDSTGSYDIALLKYGVGHSPDSLKLLPKTVAGKVRKDARKPGRDPAAEKRAEALITLGQALDKISGLAKEELQRKLVARIPEMMEEVAKGLDPHKRIFSDAVNKYLCDYYDSDEIGDMVEKIINRQFGGSLQMREWVEEKLTEHVDNTVNDAAIDRFVTYQLNDMDFKAFMSKQIKEAVKSEMASEKLKKQRQGES